MNETIDSYAGWTAVISYYRVSHRLLVLHLSLDDETSKYLVCYWCTTIPFRCEWKIDSLVCETQDQRSLITDEKWGIHIDCGTFEIRDNFDFKQEFQRLG